MQSIKGDRHVRRVIHGRERNKKKDRRYKIANVIANTSKQSNATVVLENLPKICLKNMISNVNNKKLMHRIYQAGFRGRVPFAPMPDESTPEVAVLPMKEWMRRNSLPSIQFNTLLNEMLR